MHLVWDLDGTLVDSRRDLADAVNAALVACGAAPLSVQKIVSFVGNGTALLLHRALRAADLPEICEADARQAFDRYYAAHLVAHTVAYPGVREALAGCRARGFQLSVLTNKPSAYAVRILSDLDLVCFFSAVLGGECVPALKPDPRGLERLVKESGNAAGDCWMIGDSDVDMEVAANAGVVPIGVGWGIQSENVLRAAGAVRVLGDPRELLAD